MWKKFLIMQADRKENVMTSEIQKGVFTFTVRGNNPQPVPFEYTGVDDEILANKETAHIGISLHFGTPIYDLEGPDAAEFLSSICINSFENLRMDGIRHAVICNEKGQIMTDGVVLRLDENKYRTYWLQPIIQWLCEKSELDVSGEDVSQSEYFFQIAGPKSLQILEEACECDLHDIKFAHHKTVKICGTDMRILRLGMTGGLAYEVHGDRANSDLVYERIWNAGQDYGIKKCGSKAYTMMHHTEAGFPNVNIHYPLPWYEDPDLAEWLDAHPGRGFFNSNRYLIGSVGDELECRFVTPYDVGWSKLIKFDHEFIGKSALEELSGVSHRTAVTLEWDAEDAAGIYMSQFLGREVEPYERIDRDCDMEYNLNKVPRYHYHADKVFAGEKQIGISTGRINSYYFRKILSIAFIEEAEAVEGRQVEVLWVTPGKPQTKVRARIASFPYNNIDRNEAYDVEQIPHYQK